MIDVDDLTIARVRELLASRAVTVVDIVQAVLDRLAATEPVIHSYAHVFADEALRDAEQADRRLARSALHPLHGIPFAAKDVLWTGGLPSEAGSRVLRGFRPTEDAEAVRRMRLAGGVLIGKHVTHEFATDPALTDARNAWNPEHYSGGSSSGSGNSVAVGSSIVALATDAGGSVRKPAALNGVVGLKPTYDRISRHGVIPPSGSLDTVGLLARSVEDCAVVFDAVAQRPHRWSSPPPTCRLAGTRLGLSDYFFGTGLATAVRERVEAAIAQLRELGASLLSVETPTLELAVPAAFTILTVEAAGAHRHLLKERAADYRPTTRQALELGLIIPAAHLDAAQRARRAMCAELAQAFRSHQLDALVTPTLPRPSIPVAEAVRSYLEEYVVYTAPANLTGLPALTVPCGFTPAGLPVGMQLIGRPYSEEKLFEIGYAYQRATCWHKSRPPILSGLEPEPCAVARGGL